MEIIQASALAEYRTSIHNEETWYNYSLILSAFFDDLGLGRDTVRPLKERLVILETKTERKKYEARSKDLKEIREIKNQIVDIQSDIFVTKTRKDLQWGFDAIKGWVVREQAKADAKKKSTNTVRGYIRPIKGLCEANELPFTSAQWKKIYSKFGKAPKTGKDKAYSVPQIQKLISYPDRRIPPMTLTMESSGCRVGAFQYLCVGDITPIYQNEDGSFEEAGSLIEPIDTKRKLVASRIVIYRDEPEEYLPFITPESTRAYERYFNYRREAGERVKEDSPAIRDLFLPDKGARGQPHKPVRFAMSSVKNLMQDAIIGTGLRPAKLPEGKMRWDFQMNHGLRKFFETVCDDHEVNLVHSEKLMGWGAGKQGLRIHYNRSEWKTLLSSYLKIVPWLTITDEERLRAERDIIAEKVGEEKAREFEREFGKKLKALEKEYRN